MNAKNALRDLGRIQRAPLYRAGITITKTIIPNEHQKALLHAIGAPIPERLAAVWYKPNATASGHDLP